MCIPRKINFLLLGRYGHHKEQRYLADVPQLLRLDVLQHEPRCRTFSVRNEEAYELVAWSKSLKRNVPLVLHYLPVGGQRLYFCTETDICGMDVYNIYRTRLQIESSFRDGHQFTGLLDCKARG